MTYPITTTLEELMKRGISHNEYNRLVRALQGEPITEKDKARMSYLYYDHDEPIPLAFILESNGLSDAIWSLRASTASDQDIRMLGLYYARRVEHLDKTGAAKRCNDVNERFANGQATAAELKEARTAAWAAGEAAWTADAAASWWEWEAADEAEQAAAWAAEQAAAWAAEQAAAWAAADGKEEEARESEREAQSEIFIKMCNGKAPWIRKRNDLAKNI